MADQSKIEWTDATWNPITGCSVVSPGCTNCYAMTLAGGRLKHHPSRKGLTNESKAGPVWNGKVRLNEQWLDQPLRWRRPRTIFVCAHGDLFHEAVPIEWIDRVFAIMARSPQHRFQVLTKRAERMHDYLMEPGWRRDRIAARHLGGLLPAWPLRNVWCGVSAEDQPRWDERTSWLLRTKAAVRFVSAEPLLGAINARGALKYARGIDWVIVGGESGPGSRPMHPHWVRHIREQCQDVGVAFFFKQWGAWGPIGHSPGADDAVWNAAGTSALILKSDGTKREARGRWMDYGAGEWTMLRVGKKRAGRELDGRTWEEMPA